MYDFRDLTFEGPVISDPNVLASLPRELRSLLEDRNGFIAFRGGLHVRGVCAEPLWHSLQHAWVSDLALHRLYQEVLPTDIPFAEDCLGDQFLLRNDEVIHLLAETGEIEPLTSSVDQFFSHACAEPVEFLSMYPLLELERRGEHLPPGKLIHAYPPFCTKESGDGQVSLAAITSSELLTFHAQLASALHDIPKGGRVVIRVT